MSERKPALFQKYNVPGPRYTSYPTVPYWENSPTESEWVRSLTESLQNTSASTGAALYVHIPFCLSLCTYCGCNTRITRNRSVGSPYVDALLKEFDFYRERIGKPILLSEIHIGGGTPTFLPPEELARLTNSILEKSAVTSQKEFSIEVDPRTATTEHLKTLAALGFKRLSLGVQDFDPRVQEIVHRVQSEEMVRRVTETARGNGFESVNYDLIYGLPLQTRQSVEQTVEAITRLRPDRIAFYGYAHVPWIKPGQRRFTEADLPSGEEKRVLYELGRNLLERAGYLEIGMDHFALETDSLWRALKDGTLHRSFMGYTARRIFPLIGLGVSSIGDSGTAFAQNEKLVEAYQARIERGELPLLRGHVLDAEDRVLRHHILNLMTLFKTSWEDPAFFTPHLETLPDRLREMERDGLLEINRQSCAITLRGRPFIRNACMAFDARLNRKAPMTAIFSKTI